MKKRLFFIYFSCILFTVFGQETNIDSLFQQAKKHKYSHPKKADSLYQVIENHPKVTKKILRKVYQNLGNLYGEQGDSEKAFLYYKKAFTIAISLHDSLSAGRILFNWGSEFQYAGKYENASKKYLNALKIMEKMQDTIGISAVYQHLGNLYLDIKDVKKSNEFFTKGIQLAKASKDTLALLGNSFNLAYNFQGEKQFKQVKTILDKINPIILVSQSNENKATFYGLLTEYYLFSEEKNSQKALKFAQKSYDFAQKGTSVYEKINTTNSLADAYLLLKNYTNAEIFFKKAEKMLEKQSIKQLQATNFDGLRELYEAKQNFKKALFYQKQHTKIEDSLRKEEVQKAVFKHTIQYETEKKDKEIAQQNLLLQQKNNQLTFAVGGGILILLLSLGLWYVSRQKQQLKNNEISLLQQKNKQLRLEALISGEEKERSRIAQDLHDGVNGDLSAIKYQLSNIETESLLLKTQQNLQKAITMLDSSCEQIRSISHNLSSQAIQNFGLLDAVEQFCQKITKSHPILVDFQHFGVVTPLTKNVETMLYRIVQELVFNMVKHAKASEGLVQIQEQESQLLITVEDNGIGFDTNEKYNGIGLKNIASRIEYLNANFYVESNKKGSSFLITVELEELPKV